MIKQPIIILIFLLALLSGSANAALPPLDDAELERFSSHILEGDVVNRDFIETKDRLGTRRNFTIQFKVSKIIKGTSVNPQQIIEVTYWKAGKRPVNWVGDGGQRSFFSVGNKYKIFVSKDKNSNKFILLHPNGSLMLQQQEFKSYKGLGVELNYPANWTIDASFKQRVTIWPDEKDKLQMSHILLEQKNEKCSSMPRLKQKLLKEILNYPENDIKSLQASKTYQGFELVYSWKDTKKQSIAFINQDRYLCEEKSAVYLLRYVSNELEQAIFKKNATTIFDSIKLLNP